MSLLNPLRVDIYYIVNMMQFRCETWAYLGTETNKPSAVWEYQRTYEMIILN